jgi:hypothetical protein
VPTYIAHFEKAINMVEAVMGVNEKYQQKFARKDWFRNNQSAYIEVEVKFLNARVKSHFVRYFNPTSTNIHLIENACALLQSDVIKPEHIERFEVDLRDRMEAATSEIETNVAAGTKLAADNAVPLEVKFFQEPLKLTVKILSPLCYEYLDVLQKADRLIVILECLRIRGTIERKACEQQISRVHHVLDGIQRAAFQLAVGLRARSRAAPAAESRASSGVMSEEPNLMMPDLAMTPPLVDHAFACHETVGGDIT